MKVKRDPRLKRGTAQGQMSFWDDTLNKWVETETSELFWDDVNKRLGVGNASPSAILDIVTTTGSGNIDVLKVTSPANSKVVIESTSSGAYPMFDLIHPEQDWRVQLDGGNDGFKIRDKTRELDRFYINTAGNVGIATTTPDTKLQVVGDFKSGEDSTNYFGLASDGEVSLHGTARVKNGLWVPSSGLKAPGAKPATYIEHGINGAWQFADQAIAINQETVSGVMRIPNKMDRSEPIVFAIGWSSDGISPGNVKWQLEYLWTSPNEPTNGVAQETLTVVTPASATSNGFAVSEIIGIDLPSVTDICFQFKITRLSADAQDTIANTVEGFGICAYFTSNKLGEAT